MWTINELFYEPEPAFTRIYEHPKPAEVGVVKDQNHQPKDKKGNHGDVHLKVYICCEACVKKVRKALIELNGVTSINIDELANKVTVAGDVKPEACLRAMAKLRKRASMWANAEGGGKEGKKNKKDGKQAYPDQS